MIHSTIIEFIRLVRCMHLMKYNIAKAQAEKKTKEITTL